MAGGLSSALAQEGKAIQLLPPRLEIGKPLMQALQARQSIREFAGEKLSQQLLSDLLWAGGGVNRPDGKRTAPTASNRQEIDIYAALPEGLFLYNPKVHALKQIHGEDIRAKAGTQAFVKEAAVNFVYVADYARMGKASTSREITSSMATGFIAQNVYLYCASEGLASVARANIDRPVLAKAMNLREDQAITMSQSIGYPKK